MTQLAIERQIEAIIKVTKEASRTKETARQFLIDAGILPSNQPQKTQPVETKK
ncbi:MAG: hypothetical protein ABIN67_05310 [Ferruginibacter sp.]